MDHRWIEEHGVAEAYVLGQLAPAEEASFEEHLLTCRECRERVRWADELRASLRAMASEDRERAAGLGLLAWLARRGRAARLGFAAILLLALALPAALLVDDLRQRHRVAAAGAAATRPAERPSGGGQPGWGAERQRLEAELRQRSARLRQDEERLGQGQSEIRRQDDALRQERRRGEDLRARLAELSRPQINTAVFSLGLVRGEDETNRVLLGPRPAWIVLSIELPAPPDAAHATGPYRATLTDARGRGIWTGDDLRPTASDTLVLGLYSSMLVPGKYRLVLQGPGANGERSEVPFEVLPAK
jgi:hypothetical protein